MKLFYTFLLVITFMSLPAQEYYYNGNQKVEIIPSEDSFILFGIPNHAMQNGFEKFETFSKKGFTVLKSKKPGFSIRESVGGKPLSFSPAFKLKGSEKFQMFPTKIIRVKLLPNQGQDDISKVLKEYQIAKIEKKYGIFRIHITEIHEVLNIANKIYESGIAEFAIPDFYIPISLNQVNDPLFPQQFQMNNTGQSINGVSGINDIDCNALEAWEITLGSNVTVAVFDQGLENHEDFGNRFLGGFTPLNNGNGQPVENEATHGMNSAGVIAASDNNLGIRGVAPDSNLLSINIFAGGETPGDIADGITWAINNGADILSNSWSFRDVPCNFTNIDIENAIQNAVTNGRNGNGAIVVFSSGNDGNCVNYPARNANVISVGAVDNSGNLYNYSARGTQLDLVAPSGATNYIGNVRTLDRMGNMGRNGGNYENNFGGTSAACPVVSGVAALVLSANPDLTQQEVRVLLNTTATDMGAIGFDNNFGNGRVNALAAVQAAKAGAISGPKVVCNYSNSTFTLEDDTTNSITWSTSNNLQIISSTTNTVTVNPKYSTSRGSGFITANYANGTEVNFEVHVNNPSIGVTLNPAAPSTEAWADVFGQNINLQDQGVSQLPTYTVTSSSGFSSIYLIDNNDGTYRIRGVGSTNYWNKTINLSIKNGCGFTTISVYLTPPPPDDDCNYTLQATGENSYSLLPPPDCGSTQTMTSVEPKIPGDLEEISFKCFFYKGI